MSRQDPQWDVSFFCGLTRSKEEVGQVGWKRSFDFLCQVCVRNYLRVRTAIWGAFYVLQ